MQVYECHLYCQPRPSHSLNNSFPVLKVRRPKNQRDGLQHDSGCDTMIYDPREYSLSQGTDLESLIGGQPSRRIIAVPYVRPGQTAGDVVTSLSLWSELDMRLRTLVTPSGDGLTEEQCLDITLDNKTYHHHYRRAFGQCRERGKGWGALSCRTVA